MQHKKPQLFVLALTAGVALTVGARVRADEGWGTIKGQVVWADGDAPKQMPINVDKDKEVCLKNGELLNDRLVVNPKNKGVRWCIVYLMSADKFETEIPVHPKLKAIQKQKIELDQPCCQFEPHVLALREGQTLVVKNSAGIAHNVNIVGGAKGPNLNQIVPSGGKFEVKDLVARPTPITVKCDIHSWMSGRIAVLKHPYFAVTDEDGKFEIKDAPAGDYRIVVWQEESGWVAGDDKPSKLGKKITIKAGEETKLSFPYKPSKD